MHIRPIQLLLVIIVTGISIFLVLDNNSKENTEISGSSADTIILNNEGSVMEGHTPRGFQGVGAGLFAGDNLNSGFPDGDGIQFFLTFDVGAISVDMIVSATLRSKSVYIQGSPFEDLGLLKAEIVRYSVFSSELWNIKPVSQACIFGTFSRKLLECDVTEVLKRTLTDGNTALQFRIRFEKAGDSDGEQDLVMFYNTNSNTNEPGIFQLVVHTATVSSNTESEEQQSVSARSDSLHALHVPVVLHIVKESGSVSTGRSSDSIRALFQKSQTIWDQANIVFDIELQETTLDDALQKAVAREEFGQLFRVLPTDDSALHIFFVRTLGGSNGIALAPFIALVADRTSVNDFRATAHEIGHLLGLNHTSPDRGRLLFRGANGTKLINEEITRSRSTAAFFERDLQEM